MEGHTPCWESHLREEKVGVSSMSDEVPHSVKNKLSE